MSETTKRDLNRYQAIRLRDIEAFREERRRGRFWIRMFVLAAVLWVIGLAWLIWVTA